MDDHCRRKPRAVAVAEALVRQNGTAALGLALERRRAAVLAGRDARADLYLAVSTILADRDRVFTRLKLRR